MSESAESDATHAASHNRNCVPIPGGTARRNFALTAERSSTTPCKPRSLVLGLDPLPGNVLDVCEYGFTEMLNNAVDHSESDNAIVNISYTAKQVHMSVVDLGIGIFNKIKNKFGLEDEREGILELAKGKLTTDPAHHTGEGIFFTSRMFDSFVIGSGGLGFVHRVDEDWLIENNAPTVNGTSVVMEIAMKSKRRKNDVFDQFTSSPDFWFSKTHVPLSLARYGNENLVSRSQAKRVLSRFDRFQEVFLDFSGVESIGQAFSDEIFRVYRDNHPETKMVWINTTPQVAQMIRRVVGDRHVLNGGGILE